jgi:hypothetical protein
VGSALGSLRLRDFTHLPQPVKPRGSVAVRRFQ